MQEGNARRGCKKRMQEGNARREMQGGNARRELQEGNARRECKEGNARRECQKGTAVIQAGAAWSGTGLEVINETVVSKEQSGKMERCRNLANEAEGPAEEPKRTVQFLPFALGLFSRANSEL